MKISDTGISLIKLSEGCILKPYLCSAKVPTIGYGSTRYEDGRRISMQDPSISLEQAERLLRNDLERTVKGVSTFVTAKLKQCQFDALVSLAYNIGLEAFKRSTLLRKLNAGDYQGAASEFARWNRAGGRVVAGLSNRRERERLMFCGE